MYLTEIGQIDARYDIDNDQNSKDFFHRLLTYKEIKKFFENHKMDEYGELCGVFPSVGQHGYDIQEALNWDLTLIRRE